MFDRISRLATCTLVSWYAGEKKNYELRVPGYESERAGS